MQYNQNPQASMTADEIELQKFRKWLDRQKGKEQPTVDAFDPGNDNEEPIQEDAIDIRAVERAKGNVVEYASKLVFWRAETERLYQHSQEAAALVKQYEVNLAKWQTTFDERLAAALKNSTDKLNQVAQQHAAAVSGISTAEQNQEMGKVVKELSEAVTRLLAIKQYGRYERIDPPDEYEEKDMDAGLVKHLEALHCANPECGRAKVSDFHPLCRNCQLLYNEGKLNGSWAGIHFSGTTEGATGSEGVQGS